MYLPKTDVFENLKKLDCFVAQTKPEFTEEKLPAVIFRTGNIGLSLDLDNEISTQNTEIIVDIWAKTSPEASQLLKETEKIMRKNYYVLTYSNDVPNSGNLVHIYSRFNRKD